MLLKSPVTDLEIGDMIDLEMEEPPYVDQEWLDNGQYSFEYAVIDEIQTNAYGGVVLTFANYSPVAFPIDHEVWVKR